MFRDLIVRCGLIAWAACSPGPGAGARTGPAAAPAITVGPTAYVVATLAADSVLARDADHLYWSVPAGIQRRRLGGPEAGEVELVSAATAGASITTMLQVAPTTDPATHARGVVEIGKGMRHGILVLERRDGEPARVLAEATGDLRFLPRTPVLADAWVYVVAKSTERGDHLILALPRRDHGVSLAVETDDYLHSMVPHAGALYVTAMSSTPGRTALARADLDGGGLHALADAADIAYELVIGGGWIYYRDSAAMYRLPVAGGSPTRLHAIERGSFGSALHGDHLYWIAGAGLMAMATRGAAPRMVARNPGGHGGESGVDLVFDGDAVYTTSFRAGESGVYRIGAGGAVTRVWTAPPDAYPGPSLVRIGRQLYFTVGTTVHTVGLDGRDARAVVTLPAGELLDLVEGNGRLYALVQREDLDESEVTRITPADGEAVTVVSWSTTYGGDLPRLAADQDAAYVYVDLLYGGILRLDHDAPGLPVLPGRNP